MARNPRKKSPTSESVTGGFVVRHYCQGLGDCHLIKLTKADGSDFWMLIDCGLHSSVAGSYDTIDRIVDDIAHVTGNHIDLLVVTHEHWDHVSGFLTASDKFSTIKIDQLWMGWTEDPADPDAMILDKYKTAAVAITQKVTQRLKNGFNVDTATNSVRTGIEALAGFQFGAKGEKVRSARDAAKALAPENLHYLAPSMAPFELLPGIRVYVLGPPRDKDLLKLTIRDSEMYGAGSNRGWAISEALSAAAGLNEPGNASDSFAPFDPELGSSLRAAMATSAASAESGIDPAIAKFVSYHYATPAKDDPETADQSWRRIDDDWLYASADLAMQIDSRTNNTSLVLAFEFTETGRVALFAADAQVGSWLSWQRLAWRVGDKTITGPDLLARTIYYKVSHHGSENATLKQNGLEQMIHPDLSAFVPTNAIDAAKVGWKLMPFAPILQTLGDRTAGRTVKADDDWLRRPRQDGVGPPISGSIRNWSHSPGFWIELSVA
jgi:hypothetical protein